MNPTLIRAVVRAAGRDSLPDVVSHGADCGTPGFCYYAETGAFYARHQAAIVALVDDAASDFGDSPLNLVKGFNCLHHSATDAEA